MTALYGTLGAMSLLALIACGLDKRRAVRGGRRIPEASLLTLAVLGGSPGLLLGMAVFRHKTRKPLFFLGVPLILCLQLALVWYLIK